MFVNLEDRRNLAFSKPIYKNIELRIVLFASCASYHFVRNAHMEA
jgi:hypothetical protein